ncbi:MAG: hypothetical protein ABIH75_00680, partial [Candidatus Omnitrophota bacterium]
MTKFPALNKENLTSFGRHAAVSLPLGAALIFVVSYILGVNFIIPLFLICIFAYLKAFLKDYKLLNLSFLFVIIFAVSFFIVQEGLPLFYIPFAAISMLSAILFEELALSLLITLASSVSIAYLVGDIYTGILFLISGILSIIFTRGARNRVTIIRAGFIAGLAQAGSVFFIGHFSISHPQVYMWFMLNGVISALIVIGILPVFEYLFKIITNISLLELADFGQPILQRM